MDPAAGTSTTTDSGVNVAYGVIVNGESMALETNMASDVIDTVMEENEANGMVWVLRNVAYGACDRG